MKQQNHPASSRGQRTPSQRTPSQRTPSQRTPSQRTPSQRTPSSWALAAALLVSFAGACEPSDPAIDAAAPIDAASLDAASWGDDAAAGEDAGLPGIDAADLDGGLTPDAMPLPDAFVATACDTEGAMRTHACGNCGLGSQRCVGGMWVSMGPCIGEGMCSPATIETRQNDTCAEEGRICDDRCVWSAWDEITPTTGVCRQGDTRTVTGGCGPGLDAIEECDAACGWVPTGTCIDACGDTPRTAPLRSTEICIPAGPFIRGRDGTGHESPARTVMMSSYYIDRFPVTIARYRACVDVGACTLPTNTYALNAYLAAGRDRYPMPGVSWEQANEFCSWDGGRELPTEAQWEKAARGPSPDTRIYPWGNEEDCSRVLIAPCGATAPDNQMHPYEVTAYPRAAGPYGVEALWGFGEQWVRDRYQATYYASPTSLVDPAGPSAEVYTFGHVVRGAPADRTTWPLHITSRSNSRFSSWEHVFRCSRPGR